MKNLSELSGETLLYVKKSIFDVDIMTKDDLKQKLKDNGYGGMYVFLALENPASIDMDDLRNLLERIGEQYEQYEDWDFDMMCSLKNMGETKAFIDAFNRLARENMSYNSGEMVDIFH